MIKDFSQKVQFNEANINNTVTGDGQAVVSVGRLSNGLYSWSLTTRAQLSETASDAGLGPEGNVYAQAFWQDVLLTT